MAFIITTNTLHKRNYELQHRKNDFVIFLLSFFVKRYNGGSSDRTLSPLWAETCWMVKRVISDNFLICDFCVPTHQIFINFYATQSSKLRPIFYHTYAFGVCYSHSYIGGLITILIECMYSWIDRGNECDESVTLALRLPLHIGYFIFIIFPLPFFGTFSTWFT